MKFLIEGLDRLGKDTLVQGIQNSLGYHLVLHYTKPLPLDRYRVEASPLRRYQEASFRTMFEVLCGLPRTNIICNRAHLGECVYAPMYRGYSGDYVFELEREFALSGLTGIRLVLLTEDFERSHHFRDDGQALGSEKNRPDEQALFVAAFKRSAIADKRIVCVTNCTTGEFRERTSILQDVLH